MDTRKASERPEHPPMMVGEKRCSTCGVVKPYTAFNPSKRPRDGRMASCRKCRADRDREKMAEPGSIRVKRNVINQKRWIRMNAEAVYRYLLTHPCVDCGEADPIVLDFDHVTGEKIREVSRLVRQSSWARIMEEIEKCEVRCSNCHRRKTAVQLGWYAWLGRDHDADAAEAMAQLRADVLGQSPLF